MKFYLGARFVRQTELREYAKYLAACGHTVTSRWLSEPHDLEPGQSGEQYGLDDVEDIATADTVVIFSGGTGPRSRGGYHTEFGICIGMGKPIVLVGERENVFHWLPQVAHFFTWEHFRTSYLNSV